MTRNHDRTSSSQDKTTQDTTIDTSSLEQQQQQHNVNTNSTVTTKDDSNNNNTKELNSVLSSSSSDVSSSLSSSSSSSSSSVKLQPIHTLVSSSTTTTVIPNQLLPEQQQQQQYVPSNNSDIQQPTTTPVTISRSNEAMKQLFCGGLAGSVAKTVTAPFSRLTILYQVHSMVTTKEHRPQFAMNMIHGINKIIERGGIRSLWRGNMTSVLHRFPYSAINFYVYENTLDILTVSSSSTSSTSSSSSTGTATKSDNNNNNNTSTGSNTYTIDQNHREHIRQQDNLHETSHQLVRRLSKIVFDDPSNNGSSDDLDHHDINPQQQQLHSTAVPLEKQNYNNHNNTRHSMSSSSSTTSSTNTSSSSSSSSSSAMHKFIAGAVAGVTAVTCCYPLDLVRTRLSTELEGYEHYRGITDAFIKIYKTEGIIGFYSGIVPTLLVAVPNFAISYTTYGTLKEYMIDDDLFYNLRRIDTESGEKSKLGFVLTVACGAASGILATLITFPMDTIRRRMQVQNLHVLPEYRITSVYQQLKHLIQKEGLKSVYRGLTPELIKVVPMVGTMFFVYERTKEFMNVTHDRR